MTSMAAKGQGRAVRKEPGAEGSRRGARAIASPVAGAQRCGDGKQAPWTAQPSSSEDKATSPRPSQETQPAIQAHGRGRCVGMRCRPGPEAHPGRS